MGDVHGSLRGAAGPLSVSPYYTVGRARRGDAAAAGGKHKHRPGTHTTVRVPTHN